MANYVFSQTPTFTQGLILGQLSILLLLYLVLKYLFFESRHLPSEHVTSAGYSLPTNAQNQSILREVEVEDEGEKDETETAEWFNVILRQVRASFVSVFLVQ